MLFQLFFISSSARVSRCITIRQCRARTSSVKDAFSFCVCEKADENSCIKEKKWHRILQAVAWWGVRNEGKYGKPVFPSLC